MGAKYISTTKLSETLNITECKDGFWLYDKTRGMNLAMRAKTRDEAFTDALEYYQERLKEVERKYNLLKSKVDSFVEEFVESEEDQP